MPPKKNQFDLIKGMDAKIATLEEELMGVKTTLSAMEKNQATLIALFEKSLGKSLRTEEESVVNDRSSTKVLGEGSAKGSEKSGTSQLQGEALVEFRQSVKKVELPMFDGDDPAGWISRAEVYFRVQDTTPTVRVNLAQLCMEGPTIHFFNSLLNEEEELTWSRLKDALLERYGGHGEGDVYEQLTELRQTGNVDEYITEFEYLTAQIPRLPDKQFLGYFLHGLKEEIRGKVRSLAVLSDLSRSKVLQVTRAVEKEMGGGSGSGYHKPYKLGHGSTRFGGHRPNKGSGSDWVLVKENKEHTSSNGSRGNGFGPKNDKQAQYDKKRNGPRDR
ncbi:hypothetical protein L195_g045531, partial [Trifolium pratense]